MALRLVTMEMIKEINIKYNGGMIAKDIAKEYGLAIATIREYVHNPRRQGRPIIMTNEKLEQLKKELLIPQTLQSIADKLGVSKGTVSLNKSKVM